METGNRVSYIVRVNRERVDPEKACVSVLDHGFLFGDSIYEVVCTVRGKPLAWEQHIRRLRISADRISMDLPWSDGDLKAELDAVLRDATWSGETYVRIVITRGVGRIEMMPITCSDPNLILIATEAPVVPAIVYEKGETLCITDIIRNSRRAMDPGIKSGNYLNNVLAMIEAQNIGADDALMVNEHGHLTECTTSNFYLVKDGVVRTPSLECGILAGITREILLKLAREAGIPVEEELLTTSDLEAADEAFCSGTIRGVMPVKAVIGGADWKALPGPVTLNLREIYESHVGLSD